MSVTESLPRSAYAGKLKEFPDVASAGAETLRFRGRWADFFRDRIGSAFDGRIILEIGCFDACFLSRIAQKHPHVAFVGIDWKCKAIYDGARLITQLGIRNLILLRARAQDLLTIFAEAELDEIWIFHPDPCDREQERKNRLMNKRFLSQAWAALKNHESVLTLKTDHRDYYQSALDLFITDNSEQAHPQHESTGKLFRISHQSENFWNDDAAISHTATRCFSMERTMFEERFLKKRKPIYFLELTKQ